MDKKKKTQNAVKRPPSSPQLLSGKVIEGDMERGYFVSDILIDSEKKRIKVNLPSECKPGDIVSFKKYDIRKYKKDSKAAQKVYGKVTAFVNDDISLDGLDIDSSSDEEVDNTKKQNKKKSASTAAAAAGAAVSTTEPRYVHVDLKHRNDKPTPGEYFQVYTNGVGMVNVFCPRNAKIERDVLRFDINKIVNGHVKGFICSAPPLSQQSQSLSTGKEGSDSNSDYQPLKGKDGSDSSDNEPQVNKKSKKRKTRSESEDDEKPKKKKKKNDKRDNNTTRSSFNKIGIKDKALKDEVKRVKKMIVGLTDASIGNELLNTMDKKKDVLLLVNANQSGGIKCRDTSKEVAKAYAIVKKASGGHCPSVSNLLSAAYGVVKEIRGSGGKFLAALVPGHDGVNERRFVDVGDVIATRLMADKIRRESRGSGWSIDDKDDVASPSEILTASLQGRKPSASLLDGFDVDAEGNLLSLSFSTTQEFHDDDSGDESDDNLPDLRRLINQANMKLAAGNDMLPFDALTPGGLGDMTEEKFNLKMAPYMAAKLNRLCDEEESEEEGEQKKSDVEKDDDELDENESESESETESVNIIDSIIKESDTEVNRVRNP